MNAFSWHQIFALDSAVFKTHFNIFTDRSKAVLLLGFMLYLSSFVMLSCASQFIDDLWSPAISYFANSEDPDEMPHVLFAKITQSSGRVHVIHHLIEIMTNTPAIQKWTLPCLLCQYVWINPLQNENSQMAVGASNYTIIGPSAKRHLNGVSLTGR